MYILKKTRIKYVIEKQSVSRDTHCRMTLDNEYPREMLRFKKSSLYLQLAGE